MKEITAVITVSFILLILGAVTVYFDLFYEDFNFYKAELTIDGNKVTERTYYTANKPYHVLFRNFEDVVTASDEIYPKDYIVNYVNVEEVRCQEGNPYVKDFHSDCAFVEGACPPYTERNEYGCSFGDEYGFKEGEEYWIEASYTLHPENLFEIDGNHYIKFVAYSRKSHKYLDENNFIVNGEVIKEERYFPKEYVILYIPFEENVSDYNLIHQDSLEFEDANLFIMVILAILPTLIFVVLWFFFGREKSEANIPEELSMYPNKRKPWEVAAYFNPPFCVLDKNFISSMLINFYHRKIIDIKVEKKRIFGINQDKVLIKLNEPKNLDEIEKKFYSILKKLKEESEDEGYFDLNKAISKSTFKLRSEFRKLHKEVKKIGKNYFDNKIQYILLPVFVILAYISAAVFKEYIFFFLFFVSYFILAVLGAMSALMISFKGDFYKEYRHWRAFGKYLSHSFSIKEGTHKTTVIWGEYLVYATALGVSEKVLKELKARHIINENQYNFYTSIGVTSGSFSASSGASGSGGFGGAGGGGVGGGGGGGR